MAAREDKTSLNIGDIADKPVGKPNEPDSQTKREQQDLDHQHKIAILDGLRQDTSERKKYATRIYCLVSTWLVGIFLLLIAQGALSPLNWFHLSDSVLLAAIGGTTINVIGIFLVVTRYLFPTKR